MDPSDHYEWIGKRLGRKPNGGKGVSSEQVEPQVSAMLSMPPSGTVGSTEDDLESMPNDPERWARNGIRIARQRSLPLKPLFQSFNPNAMNLHWIVSGELPLNARQAQVFALVRELEQLGHKQWVWIQPPCDQTGGSAFKQALAAEGMLAPHTIVRLLPDHILGISGDAVIATDWASCFPAAAMPLFKARFRLVRRLDEGRTSVTAAALAAYAEALDIMAFGLSPLLASSPTPSVDWMGSLPPFVDERIFYPAADRACYGQDETLHIAVDLGSGATPDVATDLTFDVLNLLTERGVAFTAHLFGQPDIGELRLKAYRNHGPIGPSDRAELFRACQVGLSLATGLDCTTQSEMFACGLHGVGLPRNEICDAGGTSPPATGLSVAIAKSICANLAELQPFKQASQHGVVSVRAAAQATEGILRTGLSAKSAPVTIASAMATSNYEHKAAVIIPSWNGGALFRDVLEAIATQRTLWSFDVLVIDSGSTDETLEIVRSYETRGVRLHTIPNSQFQHGRTRNLAISLTNAEFVAVLTQDATPANNSWLANLVQAFNAGDRVAGVFGAHEAYPEATPFVSMGIKGHFEHFDRLPHIAEWANDHGDPIGFGSVAWQNWLHYYSDNNSCMRRSVWEKIPYPDIDWGEDQVWAWEIVKQGYQKAFAHDAVVYHSHNLNAEQQRKVSAIEGEFWLRYFNYSFEGSDTEVNASLLYLQEQRQAFAATHRVEPSITDEQMLLDRESLFARYQGQVRLLHETYKTRDRLRATQG